MPHIDGVLFDLDGTLWDTTAACAAGWNRVLRRHGIASREIVAEDVRKVAGKPHEACIRESFPGLAERDLRRLIDETPGEDIRMVAELGGALFPGVVLGLGRLARRWPLFIVSNCQAGYIETFLRLNGLERTFRDFECWGRTRRSKADNLRNVIARNRLARPVFVGDTDGDQSAARACGVPFVHASYGYGACESPDFRAAHFLEVVGLVGGSGESKKGH
ncbi:MAG TPA: HAD family hydrolase [Polyangiaceae bacterium]|jgi:phosphoglycolate phosphatase